MKKLYLLAVIFFAAVTANAQLTSYGFASSTGTYTPITGGTQHSTGSAIDDERFSVTLPFTFNFNGTAYTQIFISENGYISFGATNPGSTTRSAISATATGFEIAAALSADLGGTNAHPVELRSEVIGTGTNQVFVAQWTGFAMYSFSTDNTNRYNFQIRLNQANDVAGNQTIQFVYGTFTPTSSNTFEVGLRGTSNMTFFNRTTSTSWTATTNGATNSANCTVSNTVLPASGLIFTYTPPAVCAGIPRGGITISNAATACLNNNFSLSVNNASVGLTGLTYQWQDSAVGGGWADISGATNETLSAQQTEAKGYRRKISCSNSGMDSFSVRVFVPMNNPTYATLPFTESFENVWADGCGGIRALPNNSWRNTPITTDSSWRRNDDDANGWTNNFGAYTPTSSAGSYSARFHSYQVASGRSGKLDLHLNCSSGGAEKRLTFDYINISGSDYLQISISTDGGANFDPVVWSKDSIRIRTSWWNKVWDFNSTSANTIIRFTGVSDFGTTDIGIDNIQVFTIPPIDMVATSIVSPSGALSVTNTGSVVVRVTNGGLNPIDFGANNTTVGVTITRPNGSKVTHTSVLNSGSLSPSSTQDITVTMAADFSILGNYSLRGGVSVMGDANTSNDSTTTTTIFTNPLPKMAVASGNWGDGSTWNGGTIPSSTDSVVINGFNVTLEGAAAAPYTCYSIGIGASGTLTGGSKALNIGPAGGGKRAFNVASSGTLVVNTGTNITHNGFIVFNSGSNFTMSGGSLTIDGNNGTNEGSVPSGTDIFGIGTSGVIFSSGTFNVTGGTIVIVDPHRFASSYALAYRGTSGTHRNFGVGNTVVFGDGSSTHSTLNSSGFSYDPYFNSGRLSFGNLTINTGSSPSRFVSHPFPFGISGNFTINAGSDYRTNSTLNVSGNFVNNGVFASSGTVGFHSFIDATNTPSTNAQSITGTGKFRNNVPTFSISAAGSGYAVGNVLTLTGGTSTSSFVLLVTSINGTGGITGASIATMGDYTVEPTYPAAVSGGAGTGATFTITNLRSTASVSSLTLNNTNPSGVTMGNTFNSYASQTGGISGTLTMTNGILDNQSGGALILGISPTSRGTLSYTAGFIKGKFGRWFGTVTNTTTTGDFPVGKDTIQNARVEFTSAPTKGGVLTAEFIKTAPGKGGLPLTDVAVTIERVANEGFWRISNDTMTGGNYTLSLTGRKFAGINVLSTLRTLKRPTGSTNWSLDGTAGTNTGSAAIPVVVRTGMAGFSEFAIGGGTDNVLPFTKITFTGSKNGSGNVLRWNVENELNNRGYELQRSIDGVNFSEINFAQSKNYSNSAANTEYGFTDLRPFSGNTYYRLKIVDNDGSFKYSNVVLVRGLKATSIAISGIYPNPVQSILNVIITSPDQKEVNIQITNISGQIVKTIANKVIEGDNLINININNLAKGVYTISLLEGKNTTKTLSFIKE